MRGYEFGWRYQTETIDGEATEEEVEESDMEMNDNCNRACWNCWYDEFCDWHPAGDEDACEEFVPEEGNRK